MKTGALLAGLIGAALVVCGCGGSGTTSTSPTSTVPGSTTTPKSGGAGAENGTDASSATTTSLRTTTTLTGGGASIDFTVDGTYKGQTVKGPVQSGSLRCAAITNGGLQLTWSGTVANTGQISGDLMFGGGLSSITFGDSKSQGTASVVVKGDTANRYGASSALGSGTASKKADNSGTIDAQLNGDPVGSLHLSGGWKC